MTPLFPRHHLPACVRSLGLVAVGVLCTAQVARAQASGGALLSPTLAVESSVFETRSRVVPEENGPQGVVRVSPGLRLSSPTGRVRGSLDYAGNLYYRRGRADTAGTDFQHSLAGAFTAEAVQNFAFVDLSANVSQQTISAFGEQSVEGGSQALSNRTEVATFQVSPYLRGNLGSWVDYDARVSVGSSNSRDDAAPDSRTASTAMTLKSARGSGRLGWSLGWIQTRSRFDGLAAGAADAGASTTASSSVLNAGLSFRPHPEWGVDVFGGRETADSGGVGAEETSAATSGVGLQWQPGPRTSLRLDVGKRVFGRSTRASFSHRMPRSIVTYAALEDTTTGVDALALGKPTTAYQLLFEQKASAFPDPVEREAVVLAELAAAGLNPTQLVALPTLVSSFSVQRRQDLSWAWFGLRTTLTVQAFAQTTRQIFTTEETLGLGEAAVIHGYSASLSHRLTPQATLTMGGSRRMTGAVAAQPGNDLKSAFLALNSPLGRQASLLFSARYTVFNSVISPYRETSVTGSLNLRF